MYDRMGCIGKTIVDKGHNTYLSAVAPRLSKTFLLLSPDGICET